MNLNEEEKSLRPRSSGVDAIMTKMITLATLSEATAQEVFDQVARHLLTQKEKSVDENGTCLYRKADGLKCAAGCLIGDTEYNKDFECLNWVDVSRIYTGIEAHIRLITRLQQVHDRYYPDEWADKLLDVAKYFNLSPAALDESK